MDNAGQVVTARQLSKLGIRLLFVDHDKNAKFVYDLTRFILRCPAFAELHAGRQALVLHYHAAELARAELGDMGVSSMNEASNPSHAKCASPSQDCNALSRAGHTPVSREAQHPHERVSRTLGVLQSQITDARARGSRASSNSCKHFPTSQRGHGLSCAADDDDDDDVSS